MSRKSRMFHLDRDYPIATWNPVVGCKHSCYRNGCWASILARKMSHVKRYRNGFHSPKLVREELNKRFQKDTIVFVTSMGDLWGEFIPSSWIQEVLFATRRSPDAIFFFETKNPARYREFLDIMPERAILSSTIETNRDYALSKAPPVAQRAEAMKSLPWPRKHISIEPIVDFDSEIFLSWIHDIRPIVVSIGYDNYGNKLIEPPLEKTLSFIQNLEKLTKVELKTIREAWDIL
ncbi:MAG: DUF5131 family protein [Candidatus Bathyarchaeia archaeon]